MGKKAKNKTKNKNLIPATTKSACSKEVLFEFEAHISRLEGQLHKIELQKEVDIAAALEMGRKEGYILGCQEKVEAARQAVDVADADTSRQLPATFTTDPVTGSTTILPIAPANIPREIPALQSSSPNPWGSLSRQHRHSHPHKPSAHIHRRLFYYTMDNCRHAPLIPSPATGTVETVWHPYGIGDRKSVV